MSESGHLVLCGEGDAGNVERNGQVKPVTPGAGARLLRQHDQSKVGGTGHRDDRRPRGGVNKVTGWGVGKTSLELRRRMLPDYHHLDGLPPTVDLEPKRLILRQLAACRHVLVGRSVSCIEL